MRRQAFLEAERCSRFLIAVAADCGDDLSPWETTFYLLSQEQRLRHEEGCNACMAEIEVRRQ